MDDNVQSDSKKPTEPVSPATEHAGVASADPLTDLRVQRVLDYAQVALHMDDPLQANIGSLNADLMMFAHHMQRMIKPALEKLPANPGALANVVPVVESHTRVTRQVERLTTLSHRLRRQDELAKKVAAELDAKAREEPK